MLFAGTQDRRAMHQITPPPQKPVENIAHAHKAALQKLPQSKLALPSPQLSPKGWIHGPPTARGSCTDVMVDVALHVTRVAAKSNFMSQKKTSNSLPRLLSFVREVSNRSNCNADTLLLATYYFDKLHLQRLNLLEHELPEFACCARRTFLTCLILAHKFTNDNTLRMETWHLITGLHTRDLITLERWILHKMDHDLYVKPSVLIEWNKMILNRLPISESQRAKRVESNDGKSYKRRCVAVA